MSRDTLTNEVIFYLSESDDKEKGRYRILKETTIFNKNADEADYSSTVENAKTETVEYGDNIILLRMKIDSLQKGTQK